MLTILWMLTKTVVSFLLMALFVPGTVLGFLYETLLVIPAHDGRLMGRRFVMWVSGVHPEPRASSRIVRPK